jgi:hypothetical protein
MSFLKKLQPGTSDVRKLVRSGLLVVTSAALGGIAVAIWNRRTLADIRREAEDAPDAASDPLDPIHE